MSRTCLLHSHPFRACIEEMLNSISSSGVSCHRITAFRRLQHELCSCAVVAVSSDSSPLVAEEQPDCSHNEDNHANVQVDASEIEGWTRSSCKKGKRGEDVQKAQARLVALARKRGQLGFLKPSIMKLDRLVARALAVPIPAKPPLVTGNRMPTTRTHFGRVTQRRGQPGYRRYVKCQPKPAPPPSRPYAALRWPPLRITAAALRAVDQPQRPQQPQRTQVPPEQQQPQSWLPDGSLACLDDLKTDSPGLECLLDLAELFEDKLYLARHKRHSKGGQRGRKGQGSADSATTVLERVHPLGSLDEPRAPKRETRRQDCHRHSALSKCSANIAEYWPYT